MSARCPGDLDDLVEACSPASWLELFARHPRAGWTQWGDAIEPPTEPARTANYPSASAPAHGLFPEGLPLPPPRG